MNEIIVVQGNLLNVAVDVIVNPANPQLLKGGGLSGIIHECAGDELFKWLKNWKIKNNRPLLEGGESILSPSFKLEQFKAIVHTIGAVYIDGNSNEDDILSMAYRRALNLAEEEKYESIAFPNISTGIYGYPKEAAAKVAIETIKDYSYTHLQKIVFCCYDGENYNIYINMF